MVETPGDECSQTRLLFRELPEAAAPSAGTVVVADIDHIACSNANHLCRSRRIRRATKPTLPAFFDQPSLLFQVKNFLRQVRTLGIPSSRFILGAADLPNEMFILAFEIINHFIAAQCQITV